MYLLSEPAGPLLGTYIVYARVLTVALYVMMSLKARAWF